MMITAKLRYLHIAPRKVRLVADLIRGKSVEQAQRILNFTNKKASGPLVKLLKSVLANAKNNFQLEDVANFYIFKLSVDEGPKNKRWRPRSRGRSYQIQKKTSHITLVLEQIQKKPVVVKKAKKVKKVKISEKKKIVSKIEKPKIRAKFEIPKPKIKSTMKKVFRRKAFG